MAIRGHYNPFPDSDRDVPAVVIKRTGHQMALAERFVEQAKLAFSVLHQLGPWKNRVMLYSMFLVSAGGLKWMSSGNTQSCAQQQSWQHGNSTTLKASRRPRKSAPCL